MLDKLEHYSGDLHIMETEHTLMREFNPSILLYLSHSNRLNEALSFLEFEEERQFKHFIEKFDTYNGKNGIVSFRIWQIWAKKNGKLLGFIGFPIWHIDRKHAILEGNLPTGEAYISEVIPLMIQEGFTAMHLSTIETKLLLQSSFWRQSLERIFSVKSPDNWQLTIEEWQRSRGVLPCF
ncbi:GNAT family N-acetyltransferase [Bacillus testis]|uniref:hypothetical protein n=1 Tax=Bacillus testis TaxID=1622072 RepID=UPI00067F63C8|nr:hypothetical protein [Bacillus testis]